MSTSLEIRFGSKPGARLSFKYEGGRIHIDAGEFGIQTAHLEDWQKVAVLAGSKDKVRFWLLEPGQSSISIGYGGFHVQGKLKITALENNPILARELFKSFKGTK